MLRWSILAGPVTITVEPLLKDPLNKGHDTFELSIKDKFCGPYRTMTIQFTFERGYNLCITVKLADYKAPLFIEVPLYHGTLSYIPTYGQQFTKNLIKAHHSIKIWHDHYK